MVSDIINMTHTFTIGRVVGVIASLLLVNRAFVIFYFDPIELILPFSKIVVVAMLLLASTAWIRDEILQYI